MEPLVADTSLWQKTCPMAGRFILALISLATLGAGAVQQASPDPLRFFVGRTESVGSLKIAFKRALRTRSVGQGRIQADGSLLLVQQVNDEGKAPHERRWLIRKDRAGRYSGTMSDATGPMVIDEIGGRYRFRFTAQGNLAVEQWLSPLPGQMSARSSTIIRKFGIKVATGEGLIRKVG